MSEDNINISRTEPPEERLIGSKLSAQHVLERGEEIEPGVYRIEYEDDATVIAEFAYATITEIEDKEKGTDGGRPEPEKSEPADFGYGESTGVQDL